MVILVSIKGRGHASQSHGAFTWFGYGVPTRHRLRILELQILEDLTFAREIRKHHISYLYDIERA